MIRCTRDVTSVSVVGVGPVEIVAAASLLLQRTLSSALTYRSTMRDVMLGRVNWVALVSPLFLDICSTRPEVAHTGKSSPGSFANIVRCSLPSIPFYVSSLRCHKWF